MPETLYVILGGQYYLYFINTEAVETCYRRAIQPINDTGGEHLNSRLAVSLERIKVSRPLEWEDLQADRMNLGKSNED